MTQHEINIRNLPNGERLFEPDPESKPQGLHGRKCQCPWCKEEKEKKVKINLCDSCSWEFGSCTSNPTYGCDDGGKPTDDNVTRCNSHLPPQKGWKCYFCGFDGPENQKYNHFCSNCRRHK